MLLSDCVTFWVLDDLSLNFFLNVLHSGVDIALDSESKGRGFDSHWDHLFCLFFFSLSLIVV